MTSKIELQDHKPKSHKITLYIEREMYDKMNGLAQMLGLPIATTTKLILKTGFEFSQLLENKITTGLKVTPDGKQ